MKKIKILAFVLLLGLGGVKANPIGLNVAQKAAENFYAGKNSGAVPTLTLVNFVNDLSGTPLYFVFDVNTDKGFVIVAADDAAHPIIGYSNEGPFTSAAGTNNNVDYWLQERTNELIDIRTRAISATSDIKDEWTSYSTGKLMGKLTHSITSTSVSPLLKTYWNQSPFYNEMCPGGSVTGCVATAMAQIMRYWAYPSVGLSSSSYTDATSQGYQENYGVLAAYYDTSHYVYSAMPIRLGGDNAEVAKLMYDCGVSVEMDYSPSGSGANVMGYPPSAQNSYVQYFGYDGSTINGAMYKSYTEANWIALLENELNNARPMQFQGFDVSAGGHSWVCDGYDATDEMHMNWGWGGLNNGYYLVTTMNPGTLNFDKQVGVLYGIKPNGPLAVQQISENKGVSVYPNPSHGVFNFTLPAGNNLVKVYNVLGQEVLSSSISSTNNKVNLSSQPKGIYIYRILTETGEAISTGRLAIE